MRKRSKAINPIEYRRPPKKRPGRHSKNQSLSQRKKKYKGQGKN